MAPRELFPHHVSLPHSAHSSRATVDAELIRRDGKIVPAQILNVSEGGVALRLLDRARFHGDSVYDSRSQEDADYYFRCRLLVH